MAEIRIPPGRAGRLRLRRRLEVAERGAALLDQKLRALQQEEHQLAARAEASGRDWARSAAAAEDWLLRAVLLGGQGGLRLADPGSPVDVSVHWTASMGVRYPVGVSRTPPSHERTSVPCGPAMIEAAEAHDTALDVALRHAADRTALRLVRAEIATTRQRVRMLRRHWIPKLRTALIAADFALEEQERSEVLLRRWARDEGRPPGSEPS
ncbi:V-type ATP synthase subunit D [Saccharopolyspora sp. WRP15-2]|uniref:V-type ATP synthase subunit D n=1 Tax=Saccharopolyspora oryzae TaxID=2997343 RepID=A0ABT4UTT5_9PSEU|nr:V-type ATP synthase subunit D [Saccharopolyspora oryzae]MDA3625130.1 V-type ATP synthase subunit D [Saccharopolyspora oryzae]